MNFSCDRAVRVSIAFIGSVLCVLLRFFRLSFSYSYGLVLRVGVGVVFIRSRIRRWLR